MKVRINDKEVELRRGEKIRGFLSDVSGCWKIKSLKPFVVVAIQEGKSWIVDVIPREFAFRKLVEEEARR